MEENLVIPFKNQKIKISAFINKSSDKWIIFLHGIQSNKALFKELLNQNFLKSYSLLAIDLIGFGKSSKPKNFSYDISDQSKICEAVIKRLGISEVCIVGHSLGGMVGILLADLLKKKVISLINLEGNLVYEDAGLSRTAAELTFREFKKFYEELKTSANKQTRLWLEKTPDFVFYKTCKSIIKWSKKQVLLNLFIDLKTKKLFIYGEKNSKKAEILPESISKTSIPNAGHFMLSDNPKKSFEAIKKHLLSL